MGYLIGLLSFVLIVDCLALVLLVLVQLPKKDAGAGLAFGGAASDALFGAGSGTVLTKITKYAAGAFFGLALLLSLLQSHYHSRTTTNLQRLTEQQPAAGPITPASQPAPGAPAAVPAAPLASSTNLILTTTPEAAPASTNPAPPN